MQAEPQRQEEIIYRADPFTFIFRELDLMREDIRELKDEVKRLNARIEEVNESLNARIEHAFFTVNKRLDDFMLDVNKRFDDVNKRLDGFMLDVNKRFDRLFLLVIINLLGIVAFLIKSFFF